MSRRFAILKSTYPLLALAGLGLFAAQPAFAQDTAKTAASPAIELTAEEKAERESRKSCKIAICAAMRAKAAGDDISCNVVKSWRKEQLDKLVSKARASWPWGRVRCTSDIKLSRDVLLKAMSEAKYEADIGGHTVNCTVDREKDQAEISFDFAPKVTFENGKAVKATLNWGKIKAPTLVKGAMWTATATDNTFNVLQSTVVEDINTFVSARCDEVKDEWQK